LQAFRTKPFNQLATESELRKTRQDKTRQDKKGHPMKAVSCKDVGVMNCDWRTTGESEDEVVRKAESHFRRQHGISNVPQDMKDKVKSMMHDFSDDKGEPSRAA
jgi:predicted small metal-binding protein